MIGVTRIAGKVPEEIKPRFSGSTARYVFTKPLHLSQKPTCLENGELEIRLSVIPNFELDSVILSFGAGAEVLAPVWLRKKNEAPWRKARRDMGNDLYVVYALLMRPTK